MHEAYFHERGIAYRTNEFKPERRTLIFLHGISGSVSAWYPYEPLFSRRYNVITVDLRGHGLSKRWLDIEDYEIDRYARDIIVLLDRLKIEKATFVAHSFGTPIALKIARRAPRLIEAAALFAPNYRLFPLIRTQLSLPFISLAASISELMPMKPSHGRIAYEKYRGRGDWYLPRLVADIVTTGYRSYFSTLLHIDQFTSADWSAFSMPTFIMQGRRDQMVPVNRAIALSKKLPHAKLVILDDASHMLVHNSVKNVAHALDTFLGAIE